MGFKVIDTQAPSYNSDGWCERTKLTNHTLTMKWVENLRPETLEYVRKDCLEAVDFYPESDKAGHYTDIAHYCSMRLKRIQEAA